MTNQEAKDKGFTHIDKSGDYWKVDGNVAHFTLGSNYEKLWRYAFTDIQYHIEKGDIKPL